jgi:hypothetical protein
MDSLATHPANAQQAKSFIAPGSLSFPGGAGELTPPSSEKDGQTMTGGSGANGQMNGQVSLLVTLELPLLGQVRVVLCLRCSEYTPVAFA